MPCKVDKAETTVIPGKSKQALCLGQPSRRQSVAWRACVQYGVAEQRLGEMASRRTEGGVDPITDLTRRERLWLRGCRVTGQGVHKPDEGSFQSVGIAL